MAPRKRAEAVQSDDIVAEHEAPTYPRTVELSIHQPGVTTEVSDEATFIGLERQGLIRVADAEPSAESPDGDDEPGFDPDPDDSGTGEGGEGA